MNINLTLFMQAALFAVLIWFCARYIWPILMSAIEKRQTQIADGLAAGEEAKHSLANAEKRIAVMLSEAKAQAQEIVAQGEKLKSQTIEESKTTAKVEGDRLLASAKAEIEQEVYKAKETLRGQVAQLAIAGAEKILKREVDAKAHAELLASIEKQL